MQVVELYHPSPTISWVNLRLHLRLHHHIQRTSALLLTRKQGGGDDVHSRWADVKALLVVAVQKYSQKIFVAHWAYETRMIAC